MKKIFLITIFLIPLICYSQYTDQQDYSGAIGEHDLSNLILQTAFVDDEGEKWEKPAPLGFIGDNYQRIQIHFIAMVKDEENPYLYHVTGKSIVKENICDFEGVIRVTNAQVYREEEFPVLEQGTVTGSYKFSENPSQSHVGVFSGTFFSSFIFDDNGEVTYNDLWLAGDSYCNNLFKGTWSPYNSDESKVCNWGDYRIPESGDLDVGAGEFYPNEKYFDHGWGDYTPDRELSEEKQQWWR